MSYFPKYHMAGIHDLFPKSEDYSWIVGDGNVIKTYGTVTKRHLAIQVWHTFMRNVLESVVNDNDVLLLPAYDAAIMIEQIPDDIFRKIRGDGKMQHVSTLFSMGKGYNMVYRYKKKKKCNKFRMTMDQEHFSIFTDHINNGKQYFANTPSW